MPRYFFHYRTDEELVRDEAGSELADLDAAEQQAAEIGKAIIDKLAGEGGERGRRGPSKSPMRAAKSCFMRCSGKGRKSAKGRQARSRPQACTKKGPLTPTEFASEFGVPYGSTSPPKGEVKGRRSPKLLRETAVRHWR